MDPPPGRVDGSTNSPAAWSTHLHQVCVQLLKGREFNTRSQTFSNPVSKFEADVKRVLTDPDSYRLCRPSLHEALARLYLTKGVNDSATKKEATQYVMQQLESTLPKSPPKGFDKVATSTPRVTRCRWLRYYRNVFFFLLFELK